MATVEISGGKEVAAGFRQIDKGLTKELQHAFKDIADHVVGVAQQRMPFITGTAAKSLKPRATGRGEASIAFPGGGPGSGQSKTAYYPWLDFGGKTGRQHHIVRPVVKGGRFLYPAIAESTHRIQDEALDAIEAVAKHAGFIVHG